jgi:phosphohistidine phosphatase
VQVFLIRHAEASDETLEIRDPHRPLTKHGREQASGLGERLRWHDCMPTHVWTSPLVRAVQTAELVTAGLKIATHVDVAPSLAPGESERAVVAALHGLPTDACVVLVGHEPGLSAIGALLVGAELGVLDKAEAARIVDGQLRWRFRWNSEAPEPSSSQSQ